MGMKAKWPDQVPVLTEEDICKERIHANGGCQRCLLGWLRFVFDVRSKAFVAAKHAIFDETGLSPIPRWNDSKTVSKKRIAKAWNVAMRKLGYTEVEYV